ncbi:YndM family protein [Heyndrickxia acidiproducens]|uniref:YndM family protein n=1 Tax=Heyndrickxia acidiproducens TaxID=1121084 RepID=UPI00035D75EE|nr:YndM family protein [Heyndrickxia acidiproducens]
MDHAKALIIKFVMVAVVLGIILSAIFDMSFGDTMAISVVLTILAYVLGDLMIFRRENEQEEDNQRNMMATISDFVLAFLVVWLMGRSLAPDLDDILWAALASSIVIAGGEWFFHKYLHNLFHHGTRRESTGYGGN